MFPWGLLLKPTILLGIALAGASAFGWIQTTRLVAAQDRIEAVQARFDQFKAQVAAEGRLAQERAETQRKQDLQRAKEADDEAKKRYSSLDAQYAQYRLRQRAGSGALERLLPAPAAGTTGDSSVCYSRDVIDREIAGEIGRLYAGIADDTQPYDTAVATARACKEWAVGR